MFDKTEPADLAALKSEVNTDPISMGYVPDAMDDGVIFLINDVDSNQAPEQINRPLEEVKTSEVAGVIDATEYDGLTAYDKAWVDQFISRGEDEVLTPHKDKFLAVFGAGSVTRTAALALLPKDATRAEVLFGINTVITNADWVAARDS
jgi:hypothetical protein